MDLDRLKRKPFGADGSLEANGTFDIDFQMGGAMRRPGGSS
ncbi:hypothetical protein Taci_0445 [Thermanaerovibrio acidaminovorans DSM 6589]|uniref:Uncharacterized protein n=1 Tax=Thermanaerovibrio acidaminovorans (strain ATCC 49978 / DSM 6589 / Su883) TaxID=525903 RepID=D1B8S8_THEAS|nr:hypothetical protein [Thermanaerovibrio acidaminovorans]ACZ18681.1 hypothetical protein Taci_0445 [Thermanaerovibrio acidaminovorans DSM 6589]